MNARIATSPVAQGIGQWSRSLTRGLWSYALNAGETMISGIQSMYGMSKISRWNDRLYLGNMVDACNVRILHEKGITAVANLTDDDFTREFKDYPFEYLLLGQEDSEPIPDAVIDRFLFWMDARWAAGDTILIHCHAGISRTSSFLIAWLMHCSGCNQNSDLRGEWSSWEDRISLIRPIIMPHHALKRSILSYFANREDADADAAGCSDKKPDLNHIFPTR